MSDTHTERKERLRAERAVVAPHRGQLEIRVIVEFVLTFGAFVASTALAMTGTLSYWVAVPINVIASVMIYMPLHEAVHLNISGDRRSLNWVDEVIGRMSGWIFAFGFREHRMSHMLHHAHTNQPGRDPDMVVAGSKWRIPGTFVLSFIMQLLVPVFALIPPTRNLIPAWVIARLGGMEARGEAAERLALRRAITDVVLLIGFSVAGFGAEIWLLWWVPTRLSLMWVGFIFGWFPHHPHQESERYRDTRVATFFGSTVIIRGHDHHLLHHLYPRVAHYRLPALWSDIAPLLIKRGARVEGNASPVGTPIIW